MKELSTTPLNSLNQGQTRQRPCVAARHVNKVRMMTSGTRFQARSKDQEIKRREVELDLQVSPEEIMSREVELGCESWTSFASSSSSTAVQRTLSL